MFRKRFYVVAIAAGASRFALAVDLPPAWWGSTDGNTTGQCYDFAKNDASLFDPFFLLNPFGTPSWGSSGGITWFPAITNHSGSLGVNPSQSGQLRLFVPNRSRSDQVKLCWLQYDVFLGDPASKVDVSIVTGAGSVVQNWSETTSSAGGDWVKRTINFEIFPQPDFEEIVFDISSVTGLAAIDDVCFGTHCVPEPSSLAAAGIGLAALALRRRR